MTDPALAARPCLELGITGDAQIIVAHGVVENLLQLVGEDFLADLLTILLGDYFEWYLAWTESMHLDRLGELLQPRGYLAVDVFGGQGDVEPPFDITDRF